MKGKEPMKISYYINTNYYSNKTRYVKVSVVIDDKSVFSTICNLKTTKIQCQKAFYSDTSSVIHNIRGTGKGCLMNLDELNKIYHHLPTELQCAIESCFYNLFRSFRAFEKVANISIADRQEIYKYLLALDAEIKQITSWKITTLTDKDIDNYIESDENVCNNDKRSVLTVAKMINADGLTEFVNGNIYQFNYNGQSCVPHKDKFYDVLDDNGVSHWLNEDRIKLIQVFTEPPKTLV